VDLSGVPSSALRAELARRELAQPAARRPTRSKWVSACGNTAYGGGDVSKVYGLDGHVWCRICIPFDRREQYRVDGIVTVRPMVQSAA
jgi:hypothetical protein